ncbi:MAG: sigma-54 interaction domain-containing protein, partial [Anaerovoracaceae bacterium]
EHISEVLHEKSNTFNSPSLLTFKEQEMIIKTPRGSRRYFITLKKFIPETSKGSEYSLVILKEFDDVKKLSNIMTNSYSRYTFDSIIGESKALRQTIKLAEIAAKSVSTVLITGPSGTGKELFAQAIHSASDRSSGPFISVNCGALPAGLVESELFGYEKGAFTGAKNEGQIGKFELANHGTIFLDEIGEMPLAVQASVLRVIQTKMITRIGGTTTNSLDIRIIAATNKNLQEAIKNKEFREDLYYRLNVLRLEIPSLNKRTGDIRILTDYFLESYSSQLQRSNITLSEEAYSLLENYSFPGNIRELENIIERVVNVCESDSVVDKDTLMFFLDTENLPELQEEPVMEISRPAGSPVMMKDLEKDLIIETLIATNGSVTKTAEITGIGRRTLYRKFKEYDIDQTEYKKR